MKLKLLRNLFLMALPLCVHPFNIFADEKLPEDSHHWGFRAQGELLIWKAEEDNLEYAVKIDEPRIASPINLGKGSCKSVNPDWDVGFKLGLSYISHFDNWELKCLWTRFHPDTVKSHVSTEDSFYEPIYMLWSSGESRNNNVQGTGGAAGASAKWDLDYDTLDLNLNRQFFLSRNLSLRPSIGLQSAWIRQDLHVKYKEAPFGGTTGSLIYKFDNDFWGIGLQGSLDTRWRISSHFGLYGSASGSLLWGPFKVKQDGTGTVTTGFPSTSPLIHIRNSYHTVQGSIDLAIGIESGFTFHHGRREVLFNFGWEQLIWFNQNQLINGINTSTVNTNIVHGDLGLSGFVLGVQVKL